MNIPSRTLVLSDAAGTPFGTLRIAPTDGDRTECIFDVPEPSDAQGLRPEVRWLHKRHYQRWSEHRFTLDKHGVIRVSKGDFELILEPAEGGGFQSRLPLPPLRAAWGPPP